MCFFNENINNRVVHELILSKMYKKENPLKLRVLVEVHSVYDPAIPWKTKMSARIETVDIEAVYHSSVENVFKADIFWGHWSN